MNPCISVILGNFFVAIDRTSLSISDAMAYNRRALLKELDALVSANPRIRLAEIAAVLGVNRQTIENAMRLNRRLSFREYKRKELLKKVDEMLKQPDLTVKEIGIRLGYASAASFSRFVQRSTGKSPGQLRKDGG